MAASENELQSTPPQSLLIDGQQQQQREPSSPPPAPPSPLPEGFMQKFRLYETRSVIILFYALTPFKCFLGILVGKKKVCSLLELDEEF